MTVVDQLDSAARRERRQSIAATVARQAASLTGVYEAEWFTSSLLGQLWDQRGSAPPIEGVEPDLVLVGAIVDDLAEHGGAGARLVLHAIARLAGGELGARCVELANSVSAPLPAWAADIGRSAVTSAQGTFAPGDGTAFVLEVRGAGMVDHAHAVFIDERHGGAAKQLGLLYGRAQRSAEVDGDLGASPTDVRDACRRTLEAIAITDGRPAAPVGETFSTLRTIALARARSGLPAAAPVPWMN